MEPFRPTWYTGREKSGYTIEFVAERGGEIWFGGDQAERFASSGLYRFDPQTGAYYQFTPADGFATASLHQIYDGLWLGDQLWLQTSAGLCRVTPRIGAEEPKNAANR